MDVLRATVQTRFPMVVEQLGRSGLCSPLPAFFLRLIHPRFFPLPETIPPWAAGNPPVCWKASFTGTQQPFQTDMWFSSDWIQQASQSFRRCEITTDWFRGRKSLTGEMFMTWCPVAGKHASGTIIQGWSRQSEHDPVCQSWKTGQGLSDVFSIQIAIMFAQWTTVLFHGQWALYWNVAVK